MWNSGIFVIFFVSQAMAIGIIVVILKKILDRNLIDLAIQQLEAGRLTPQRQQKKDFDYSNSKIVVVTHRKIRSGDSQRVLKAVTKNMPGVIVDFEVEPKVIGGMIIKVDDNAADYSLIDRLRRAR